MSKCGESCEIFSRVCGYVRPYKSFNRGKIQEFNERKKFNKEVTPNYDGRSIFEKQVMIEKEIMNQNLTNSKSVV